MTNKPIKTLIFGILVIMIILFVGALFLFYQSQHRTIVRLESRLQAKDKAVVTAARNYHGTPLASLGPDSVWRFINENGHPCKLFREVRP